MQNFCVSATEVQLPLDQLYNSDGSPTSATELMELLNTVFTVLFACELLLNFLSQPMRKFFSNAWSIFDTIVVFMSLVVLGPLDFPISILRALRVVRLFGRLESSKKILAALSVSLVPMCNAFFIMLIVAMICEFPLPTRKVQRFRKDLAQCSRADLEGETRTNQRNLETREPTSRDSARCSSADIPCFPSLNLRRKLLMRKHAQARGSCSQPFIKEAVETESELVFVSCFSFHVAQTRSRRRSLP
jgi:hypothetical protein